MTDRSTTVGFIYPDHAAEDDYAFAGELLGVDLRVVHVYGTDLHAVAELLDLGSRERLAGGAAELAAASPDAVMWACTSGSFVYGFDGARRQVEQLAAVAGVPASSTSFAFVGALEALGSARVAVVASYPDEVATLFADFLEAAGIVVTSLASAGIGTAAEVGTLTADEVGRMVVESDRADADTVLVPDTAMHTVRALPDLEARVGKPVLTANQVTIWEGLRLAGCHLAHASLGALFAIGADRADR